MRRRHFEAKLWATMFERWSENADGYQEMPIMWPRLSPWWPWHPAVIGGAVVVLVIVFAWVA